MQTNGDLIVSRILGDPCNTKSKLSCGWDNDWDKDWDEGPWDKESWSDDWGDSHH